jgi:hypothetical protein
LTLQRLADGRSNGAEKMLKQVLLDLYTKSGWHQTLHSSVYADVEKNTKDIQAPCLTILGESTPEAFFDGLDSSHIAEGLIPRFLIMEYSGDRPPRNKNAHFPPGKDLVQRFADFVTISLTITNNNSVVQVSTSPEAFDVKADGVINSSQANVDPQLWNRAHLKALKLAGLLAVGVNPHKPVITADLAQWAIDFVMHDIRIITTRFKKGDVGSGDQKQINDMKRVISSFFKRPSESEIKDPKLTKMRVAGVIPHSVILRRTAALSSFRTDKMGSTMAIKRALQSLIDSGLIAEVPRVTAMNVHQSNGILYGVLGELE